MAIDRTAYNALIDDDGSNLVGTLIQKTTWKDVVLDPVDAALIDATGFVTAYALTGTVNDWAIGGHRQTVVQWAGAAPLTVTGIAGGVAGDVVTFKHTGSTSYLLFAPLNAGSVAANRLVNVVTASATPVGSGGWATYVYSGAQWLLIDHEQGQYLTPPFAAGDFFGSGGITWTMEAADVETWAGRLSGRSYHLLFSLVNSQVAGASADFRLYGRFPFGGIAAKTTQTLISVLPTGITPEIGAVECGATGNAVAFQRAASAAWPVTVNNVIRGQFLCELT